VGELWVGSWVPPQTETNLNSLGLFQFFICSFLFKISAKKFVTVQYFFYFTA